MSADLDRGPILICLECEKEAEEGARGWRAFLTIDDEVATSCPQCAEAEFGG